MKLDAKISIKYWQKKFNALKRTYTMLEMLSTLGCKDGLIYTNH
jgi:hypothetical protein